jgi:hypothetical protein
VLNEYYDMNVRFTPSGFKGSLYETVCLIESFDNRDVYIRQVCYITVKK